MRPHHLPLLLASMVSLAAACEVSMSNLTIPGAGARPRHHLALLQSVIGAIGVILNSLVFYVFISERQNMARPVNVLVWWVICTLRRIA